VDKLLEIMEVERGDNLFERAKPHTDVRERYIEFTQGIRPETSSSSVKSADRVSPKRKPAKEEKAKTAKPKSATKAKTKTIVSEKEP
jgi:hypothetical protein